MACETRAIGVAVDMRLSPTKNYAEVDSFFSFCATRDNGKPLES